MFHGSNDRKESVYDWLKRIRDERLIWRDRRKKFIYMGIKKKQCKCIPSAPPPAGSRRRGFAPPLSIYSTRFTKVLQVTSYNFILRAFIFFYIISLQEKFLNYFFNINCNFVTESENILIYGYILRLQLGYNPVTEK